MVLRCARRARVATLVTLAGWCGAAWAQAPPTLSIDERVEARRAVERVYWSHRTWPDANPTPKPELEQVLADESIRHGVEDALRASRALDGLWGRPITLSQLQAELERMARSTKSPQVLREVFAALGDSPALIGETIARPILTRRLLQRSYARDDRFHAEIRAAAEAGRDGLVAGTESMVPLDRFAEFTWLRAATVAADPGSSPDPSTVSMTEGEWSAGLTWLASAFEVSIASDPEDPVVRSDSAALLDLLPVDRWSDLRESDEAFYVVRVAERGFDHLRIVTVTWPKTSFEAWWDEERESWSAEPLAAAGDLTLPVLPDAACTPDSWRRPPEPPDTIGGTVVWTGGEMIVWGGTFLGSASDGGRRYDPATDTWSVVTTHGAPGPRSSHVAVWTGNEMIVWGGSSGLSVNTGGRYDPTTDTWRPTSVGPGVPAPRSGPVAVWTGSEMIVWGGSAPGSTSDYLRSGARYSPTDDAWTPMRDAPSGRVNVCFVWTGTELLVWGGVTSPGVRTNTGLRYSPADDGWFTIPTTGAPSARTTPSAVWTGRYMIVWGGFGSSGPLNSGGYFDTQSNTWTPTPTAGAPSARALHTAVWTGSRMIVWGGRAANGSQLATGAMLDPQWSTWGPTAIGANLPAARERADAVWTGAEMIVWGGSVLGPHTNSGGRYDPATDAWARTSVGTGVPTGRTGHTAVWTGTEMIVWGGSTGLGARERTGGRYDPMHDTWRSVPVTSATAEARENHVAIWTGSEMIVWGGRGPTGSFVSSGGRFDPQFDVWRSVSTANVPSARIDHTAVWTGSEMVIWGGVHAAGGTTGSGARYAPATNSWSPTSLSGAPTPRGAHTALWIGNEMLVWGGGGSGLLFADGGLYDPTEDVWRPVTETATVSARARHTAVWTGYEMILWGGSEGAATYPIAGGGYDPVGEVWRPTAVDAQTPEGRLYHTAVWTGTEMIVWGGNRASSMGRYCGCAPTTWYRDADGDGFGGSETIDDACTPPLGYVATAGDCDDDDALAYPHAPELCDLRDNDCDGMIDEGAAASCDDGTLCTIDRCESGSCRYDLVACEDGSVCTDDTCDPTSGCWFDVNGTCDHSPLGQGYFRRICDKPHGSGEFLTPFDAVCVSQSRSFSDLRDTAAICARLTPDPPSDKCAQAEAQFLTLQLNLCRHRVESTDRIRSACGAGGMIVDSVAEIDTILSSAARDHESCALAQCLADEINSGTALETDSLRLSKHGTGIRLTWTAPYTPDRGDPRLYRVFRRRPGEASFVIVAETGERFVELEDDSADAEFDVGFVW